MDQGPRRRTAPRMKPSVLYEMTLEDGKIINEEIELSEVQRKAVHLMEMHGAIKGEPMRAFIPTILRAEEPGPNIPRLDIQQLLRKHRRWRWLWDLQGVVDTGVMYGAAFSFGLFCGVAMTTLLGK